MAAVLLAKMVNLCHFRVMTVMLGRRYTISRFYLSFGYTVNRRVHSLQMYERRSFVKAAHNNQSKEYRSNNAIKAKYVRLIDQEGKNLGILSLKIALEKGKKENCMVVEVRRTVSETVCKLISQQQLYEKMREEKKKHVKTSKMKEIKVTGKISEHDLETKLKKIVKFLEDRDSVKVFVAHRRLQNTSVDDKNALIKKIAEKINDVGILQGETKVVGNGVRAIFIPLQRK